MYMILGDKVSWEKEYFNLIIRNDTLQLILKALLMFNYQDNACWSYGQSNLRLGSIPNTGNTSSMLSLHKITSPPQPNNPSSKRHSRPNSGVGCGLTSNQESSSSGVASTFAKLFHQSKDRLPEWNPKSQH